MDFAPNSPNEVQELEIKGLEKIRKGLLYLTVSLPLIIAGDFLVFKAYIYKISGEVGGLMLLTAFILGIIAVIPAYYSYGFFSHYLERKTLERRMKMYLEKYNIEKRVEDELESLGKDEIEVLEKTGKITDSFYWGLNFFFGGVGADLGLVIVLAIAAVVFDTYHPHSLLYFLLAFPFLIIGEMILGIELYGIGQAYNEGLLKKGGILVTSVVTSIIGFILACIGLGNVISKLKSGVVTTTITQQSVQSSIHQIGVGSLNAYGEAYIVIYTPSPTRIVSAEIIGKSIVSSFIIPNLLFPGNNDVTIHFGTITGLTPNATYTIKLTLGDGKTIETTVSYKP